jgi:hypothetical protein
MYANFGWRTILCDLFHSWFRSTILSKKNLSDARKTNKRNFGKHFPQIHRKVTYLCIIERKKGLYISPAYVGPYMSRFGLKNWLFRNQILQRPTGGSSNRAAALPNLILKDPLHLLLWIFSAVLLAGIGHACLSGMASVRRRKKPSQWNYVAAWAWLNVFGPLC